MGWVHVARVMDTKSTRNTRMPSRNCRNTGGHGMLYDVFTAAMICQSGEQ